jgi:hypothetical protein
MGHLSSPAALIGRAWQPVRLQMLSGLPGSERRHDWCAVVMVVGVVMGLRGGQWLSFNDCQGRGPGIGFTGADHLNALLCQPVDETLSGAGAHQYVEFEQGMGQSLVFMNRQLFRQIDSGEFHQFPLGVRLVGEKPAGLSRMGGNGAKILTGNGNFHGLDLCGS